MDLQLAYFRDIVFYFKLFMSPSADSLPKVRLRSLNFPACPLNVPGTFPECSQNAPQKFLDYSLTISKTYYHGHGVPVGLLVA